MPSEPIRYLTVDEALALHDRLVERFGGPPGVRDLGLLESALYRPRTGYYDDLDGMAAALFESLLMNDPFVDGNKRVAFFGTDVFLRLNGAKLEVDGAGSLRGARRAPGSRRGGLRPSDCADPAMDRADPLARTIHEGCSENADGPSWQGGSSVSTGGGVSTPSRIEIGDPTPSTGVQPLS